MHATNFIISDAKLENNHTEGDLPPTHFLLEHVNQAGEFPIRTTNS